MKKIFTRILFYSIGFLVFVFLFNFLIYTESEANQKIITSTPFFAMYKICYSLWLTFLFGVHIEKVAKKFDENLLLIIIFCVTSLIFLFVGYYTDPTISNEPYSNYDYFLIIFGLMIFGSLYYGIFTKSKKYFNNS